MKKINKVLSFLLILTFLLTGFPSELKIFAAPEDITLTVEYDPAAYKYKISYPISTKPARVVVKFHTADNVLVEETFTDDMIGFSAGKASISIDEKLFSEDKTTDGLTNKAKDNLFLLLGIYLTVLVYIRIYCARSAYSAISNSSNCCIPSPL